MELRKIADKLGIGAYPEGLESVQPVDICDEARIWACYPKIPGWKEV